MADAHEIDQDHHKLTSLWPYAAALLEQGDGITAILAVYPASGTLRNREDRGFVNLFFDQR